MIKVREAVQSDVTSIVMLGKALQQSSSYASKQFSDEKAHSMVSMMIDSESDCAFVADDNGELIGYFLGGLNYEWFSDELLAFDYSVYVTPLKRNGRAAMRLFAAFEAWARNSGAIYVHIGISTNINVERTRRFYHLLGYEDGGVLLEKRL